MKDKQGMKHSQLDKVLSCWEEHFKTHLNSSFPDDPEAIINLPNPSESDNAITPISREVIIKAIRCMKNGKAAGIDAITAELVTAGGNPMINMLEKVFTKVKHEEELPRDWPRMLVNRQSYPKER